MKCRAEIIGGSQLRHVFVGTVEAYPGRRRASGKDEALLNAEVRQCIVETGYGLRIALESDFENFHIVPQTKISQQVFRTVFRNVNWRHYELCAQRNACQQAADE